MKFLLRPETFCIHRLPPDRELDLGLFRGASWYSVTRTGDELSIVAPQRIDLGATEREDGWVCLQIAGVLDFGMVGVIAGISTVLAAADVSIFTVSTYSTDHILVRAADRDRAIRALQAAGHEVPKLTD